MRFKLILAVVDERRSRDLIKAAREAGATGSTVITGARGEGCNRSFGIFGLAISEVRDAILFLVEEHRARRILETLARVGEFDDTPGTGIAVQLNVEDALGVRHQMQALTDELKRTI